MNLLDNAVKFSEAADVVLRVGYRPQESSLDFEVEDNGPGIAPDDVARLFDAFEKPEISYNVQGGIGLGLSICRQYVRLMGGEIRVTSQLGKGSIFKFDVRAEPVESLEGDAEQVDPAQRDSEDAPEALTSEMLSALPEDFLAELLEMASRADATAIMDLIQQIEKEHPDLVEKLADLVHNFRFDTIIALIPG